MIFGENPSQSRNRRKSVEQRNHAIENGEGHQGSSCGLRLGSDEEDLYDWIACRSVERILQIAETEENCDHNSECEDTVYGHTNDHGPWNFSGSISDFVTCGFVSISDVPPELLTHSCEAHHRKLHVVSQVQ